MGIQEILDRDKIIGNIEELRDIVVGEFDTLDTLVIMWETKEGVISHRGYGTSTSLIGLLSKAEFIILRQLVGDSEEEKEDELHGL